MNLSLNLKQLHTIALSSLLALSAVSAAQGNEWSPVTGSKALQNYMSGMKAERTLPSGEVSRGEYKADGSGTLTAWGADIPRTWEVKGDDQVCITEKRTCQFVWVGAKARVTQ